MDYVLLETYIIINIYNIYMSNSILKDSKIELVYDLFYVHDVLRNQSEYEYIKDKYLQHYYKKNNNDYFNKAFKCMWSKIFINTFSYLDKQIKENNEDIDNLMTICKSYIRDEFMEKKHLFVDNDIFDKNSKF